MKLSKKELLRDVKKAVDFLRASDAQDMIRVVSHLDCDGICACALLIKALNNEKRRYSTAILPQLDEHNIRMLSKEDYCLYIFSDLGSGQADLIEKHFKDKKVIILDHHRPQNIRLSPNIVHVNPHLNGINGSGEISGSGVVYLFSELLNEKNREFAYFAVIGAIGDSQERNGFSGLNDEILNIAVDSEKIRVSKGLRLFGRQTKPLHKILESCFDPYIPGVTGSYQGARDFLNELGIKYHEKKTYKKLIHLTEEEQERLAEGIIERRAERKNPSDIFGKIYTLVKEAEGPLRDAREFSTLLNACGRLGKPGVGISVLLGDKKMKKKGIELLSEYKQEIVNSLSWYQDSIGTKDVIKGDNYLIINAKHNILPTMIGTIASILSKSNSIKDKTIIISMARSQSKKTKISIRASDKKRNIDVREIISHIISAVGGETGGHKMAAGAFIDTSYEKEFISNAVLILDKYYMQEII